MELRSFIKALDEQGMLKRITSSVNWQFEVGQIARKFCQTPLLFESINDYPGHRIFTGGLSSSRSIALALGMKSDTSERELVSVLLERIKKPIMPVVKNTDRERVIVEGKDINLYALPVPWWSEIDGGRYIGTWHVNVSKDPISRTRNVGVYRMQIVNRNQTTISVSRGSHLGLHIKNAEMLGQNLEMALAIGVNESLVMAGGAAASYGTDEYAIAGALQAKGIELVHCNSIDLEVPAEAEFVLEGVIRNGIRVQDGPYLDYSGIPSVNPRAYLFEVKSISCKREPIFRGMSVGVPGAEDHQLFSILSHLGLVDFHSSRLRQKVQNLFLRHRFYRPFQYTGRIGSLFRNSKKQCREEV